MQDPDYQDLFLFIRQGTSVGHLTSIDHWRCVLPSRGQLTAPTKSATCFISDDIQNVTSVTNQENVTSVPKQEYSVRAEIFKLVDYKTPFTLYNIGPVSRNLEEPLKVKITLNAASYWAKNYFVFCLCFPSTESEIQNINSIDYCKSEGGKHFSRVCLERSGHNELYTKSGSFQYVPGTLGYSSPFAIKQRSGTVDIFVAFGTPYENQNIPTVVITSNAFLPDTATLRYNFFKKIKWSTESGVADYCQIGAYTSDNI
uniref:Uncharacterized protein n=1 Tax=Panagrolaimus sp. PS1159 TaxID=55785 RepID=A0AC35FEJ6_9BILA